MARRCKDQIRAGQLDPPLPGTCVTPPGPKTDLPSRTDFRQQVVLPTQAFMPETWFFFRAIVLLPLPKKWRLGKETSCTNSVGAISRVYLSYILKSPVPASHPSPGRVGDAVFRVRGRWEACGQFLSGFAWARGSPSLPRVGLRNSGGPGEAWKTELRHQPSLERWLGGVEGPPSGILPTSPQPLCHPAAQPKEPERDSVIASPSQAGRGHLEGLLPSPALV